MIFDDVFLVCIRKKVGVKKRSNCIIFIMFIPYIPIYLCKDISSKG